MDEKKFGEQLYVLGRLFRILMDSARQRGANSSELENASHNPMAGIGYAYNLVIKLHKLNRDLENKVSALFEDIEPEELDFRQSPSLELQNSFMLGYEKGARGLLDKSKIADARKKAGITQSQLAEKIGVQQKDISRWENGIVIPSAQRLKQIAETLDCSIDELI